MTGLLSEEHQKAEWANTYQYRMAMMANYENIKDVINDWPLYASTNGPSFVCKHFT